MKGTVVKLLRFLGGCAVVAAALVGVFVVAPAMLHSKAHKEEERPAVVVPISVARAVARRVERRVAIVGTLEGFVEVDISAKVEGRVLRIHHDMGDLIAPGEPLCDIDPIDYRLAANESERGLQLELARLGLTEWDGKAILDLNKIPTVMRAKNLEENARQVRERARRLVATRVISTEESEKAQTESKVASANRVQAELDAQSILASARLRQAQFESAKQKIADARILAPALSPGRLPSGIDPKTVRFVVAARKVSEGEMCRVFPSGVIFRLVIDKPLKLVAQVPERYSGEVRLGQSVSLMTEAYPGESFAGKITRLNPTVERASRSFMVEVTVPNDERRLRAGSFVKASIFPTREADSVTTVPEEAVVRFAGVVKVFAIEGEHSRAVEVRTGEVLAVREGEKTRRWVEVIGKLSPAASVAVSGHSQLAEGTKVRARVIARGSQGG